MLSKYITNFYIKGRFVTSSKSWNLKNFTIYGDLTSLKPISLHLANNSCHNKTVLRFCGRYRANKRSEWPCLPAGKRSINVTPPWDQGVFVPKRLPTLSVRTRGFFLLAHLKVVVYFARVSVVWCRHYINVFFLHVLHALLVLLFFIHFIFISTLHFCLA